MELTALEAKELSESYENADVSEITDKIREQALRNERRLYVYNPLSKRHILKLESLGYQINHGSSIALQKEGIYCIISW